MASAWEQCKPDAQREMVVFARETRPGTRAADLVKTACTAVEYRHFGLKGRLRKFFFDHAFCLDTLNLIGGRIAAFAAQLQRPASPSATTTAVGQERRLQSKPRTVAKLAREDEWIIPFNPRRRHR